MLVVCIERVCKKTVDEIRTQEEPVLPRVSPAKKEGTTLETQVAPGPVAGGAVDSVAIFVETNTSGQPMEVSDNKGATSKTDATARRGDEPTDVNDTQAGDGDVSQSNLFNLLLSPEATTVVDKARSPEEDASIRALGASLAAAVGSSLKLNDSNVSRSSQLSQPENLSGSFLSAPMLVDAGDSEDEVMEVDGDKGETPVPQAEKDVVNDGSEDVSTVPSKQTVAASSSGRDSIPRHKRIDLSRAAVIGKTCMKAILDEGPIGRMIVTPVVSVAAAAGGIDGDKLPPASGQKMNAKRPVVQPKAPRVKPDPLLVLVPEKSQKQPSADALAQQARNAAQAASEVDASELDTPEFRALQKKLNQDRADGE